MVTLSRLTPVLWKKGYSLVRVVLERRRSWHIQPNSGESIVLLSMLMSLHSRTALMPPRVELLMRPWRAYQMAARVSSSMVTFCSEKPVVCHRG